MTSSRLFPIIKSEIRVLGIDDGKFDPHTKGKALVIGVVFRGGYWFDGLIHTEITIDGFDATENIASMILKSSHNKQLRILMLNGVTFAGFNVVDIQGLNLLTNLPVIAVTCDRPDLDAINKAIKNLPEYERRWKAILNAEEIYELNTRHAGKKIYFEVSGISVHDAQKIIQLTSTRSSLPEPLRVAHLIASGLT